MCPYTLTVSLTSSLCTISVSPFGSVLTTGWSVEGGTSSRASALAAHEGSVVPWASPSEIASCPPKPPPPGTGRPEPRGSITPVTAWPRSRYLRATRFTSATVTFSMRFRSSSWDSSPKMATASDQTAASSPMELRCSWASLRSWSLAASTSSAGTPSRATREDRAHFAPERVGVAPRRERGHRIGEPRLRQRVESELGGDGLALGHEAVEIEAPVAEHIREHLERGEVVGTRSGRAQRDHQRAARAVGVDA